MRRLLFIVGTFAVLSPAVVSADCRSAISNGEDAYSYSKKTYYEDSLVDAQNYAQKANKAAEDAASAAQNCKCNKAASDFDDATMYSRRANNASGLSELRDNARRAMRSIEYGLTAVGNCH
jgi:hypothetical protein